MSTLRRFVLRLYEFLGQGRSEEELQREMAAHLALLEEDLLRRGLSPDEASLQARRRFGGVELAKDRHRDARSFVWLEDARRDLRHAVRTLLRAPGFTAAIVLTLAAGIGANTAMFTVIDGVVLRPLGYPEPDRIVAVRTRWIDTGRTQANLAGGDQIDLAAEREAFAAFAYYFGGETGVQLGDRAEMLETQRVHPDFFQVFGIPPAAGRLFNRDDAQRSAIVGLGFAQRQFGGAAAALGQALAVGDSRYEIVGVMPEAMRFPARTEAWVAAPLEPENRNRSGHNYRAVARLAPGVSLDAANARIAALGARLGQAFPDSNKRKTFVATPLRDELVKDVRATLFLLMGALALVLLIGCANVANLVLARSAGRARELAVRAALGAGRRHIVSQLLAESLVLAGAAGVLGLLLARVGRDALVAAAARYFPLPRLEEVQIDGRVLLFTAAVSMLTAVAVGLAPALRSARPDLGDALHQGGTRGTLGAGASRLRGGLVIAQIALSCMLAVDAGLLLRSFVALGAAPLGFRKEGVLVAYAHAPARGGFFSRDRESLDDHLRVGRLFDDLLARVRALPEVVSAGAAMGLPTGHYDSGGSYAVEGRHTFGGDFRLLPSAGFRLASPGYFRAMGIPVVRGREFDETDVYERPFTAVVSEALARETFPGQDPIGQRIMCGYDSPEWMTIVGVVGDVRQYSPASTPSPELYMPVRQHPFGGTRLQLVVRTGAEPESLIGSVRQTLRSAAPDVAVRFTTLESSVDGSVAGPRFRMALVSAFAALALLLAASGMYAVMSYVTSQRTSEFGLRAALGARTSALVRLVLGSAARLATVGVLLGIALALLTGRVLSAMLFGVTPFDTATYGAVLLLALPVVLLAAAVPAVRAARVDPMVALRES